MATRVIKVIRDIVAVMLRQAEEIASLTHHRLLLAVAVEIAAVASCMAVRVQAVSPVVAEVNSAEGILVVGIAVVSPVAVTLAVVDIRVVGIQAEDIAEVDKTKKRKTLVFLFYSSYIRLLNDHL